jgi:CysZ protein
MSAPEQTAVSRGGCFSFPGDLIAGAVYPFRALGVLRRSRSLWKYVIIPLLVNIVVGITLYAGLLWAGLRGIDNLLLGLPEWAMVFEILLQVVLVVLLLIVIGFVLLQFGVVLGAPWYGQLAEHLEQLYTGHKWEQPATVMNIVRDIGHALAFEMKKLLLLVGVGVPVLLLHFLPPVGSVAATVGGISLAATITCLDFFDASLGRRRLHFRKKLGIIWRNLPASGGFALVCLGLVSIPFINLLAIPLCVTAGTLFFCDRVWAELRAEGYT